jgi:hypothetical protein
VSWSASATITADDALAAIEALGLGNTYELMTDFTEITVDGHEFAPNNPPGCSAQTFPGTRIDQPEWCESDVTWWDEHQNPWCAKHFPQPDDGEGE